MDDFISDSQLIEKLIQEESSSNISTLLGHIRLCGAIPESYGHDITEEKCYSKYTDIIISNAFKSIGLTSLVIKQRANVADVECYADGYSFVQMLKPFV